MEKPGCPGLFYFKRRGLIEWVYVILKIGIVFC